MSEVHLGPYVFPMQNIVHMETGATETRFWCKCETQDMEHTWSVPRTSDRKDDPPAYYDCLTVKRDWEQSEERRVRPAKNKFGTHTEDQKLMSGDVVKIGQFTIQLKNIQAMTRGHHGHGDNNPGHWCKCKTRDTELTWYRGYSDERQKDYHECMRLLDSWKPPDETTARKNFPLKK